MASGRSMTSYRPRSSSCTPVSATVRARLWSAATSLARAASSVFQKGHCQRPTAGTIDEEEDAAVAVEVLDERPDRGVHRGCPFVECLRRSGPGGCPCQHGVSSYVVGGGRGSVAAHEAAIPESWGTSYLAVALHVADREFPGPVQLISPPAFLAPPSFVNDPKNWQVPPVPPLAWLELMVKLNEAPPPRSTLPEPDPGAVIVIVFPDTETDSAPLAGSVDPFWLIWEPL